jgi:hypothetical protein
VLLGAIPNSVGICPIHRCGKYFCHEFVFKGASNCSMLTDYSPSLFFTQWCSGFLPVMVYIIFTTMEHAICMKTDLRFFRF